MGRKSLLMRAHLSRKLNEAKEITLQLSGGRTLQIEERVSIEALKQVHAVVPISYQ